jgi:hypothetical protein
MLKDRPHAVTLFVLMVWILLIAAAGLANSLTYSLSI